MTFKTKQMECEVLTKYAPSLVCTVAKQDIAAVMGGNVIQFPEKEKTHKIGADLTFNPFGHVKLGHDKGKQQDDPGVYIKSGLKDGYWSSESGSRENMLLKKVLIRKVSWTEPDEDPHRLQLANNFKDRFSQNGMVMTKDLISAKLPSEIDDIFEQTKKGNLGPDSRSDNIEHEGVKLNWYRHSLGGYGGSGFEQVLLEVKDGKIKDIKTGAKLAIRQANSFQGVNGKSTHNNLIFDKLRVVL